MTDYTAHHSAILEATKSLWNFTLRYVIMYDVPESDISKTHTCNAQTVLLIAEILTILI